jgi:death on curing protein
MMDTIRFLTWEELMILHEDQLQKYGGQQGFIDENVIRSVLSRAQFTAQYNPDADIAGLAADYLFGFSTTQGFVDGNKRMSVTAAFYFLSQNGYDMVITNRLLFIVAMAVARDELDRDDLADLIRAHLATWGEES